MDGTVADRISQAITPLVGSVLASVTVDVEARRLGKIPDDLTAADIVPVSVAIERHLVSFVGPDLAQAAAARVREITPT